MLHDAVRASASGAVRADAAEHDVVPADRIAEPRADPVDQPLKLGILERVHPPAAIADRVMVVLAAGVRGLVTRDPVDVDPVHELELREHVERAVDAGQADRLPAARPQAIVDLLGAQAAVLAAEEREDLLAGAAGPVTGPRELAMGMVGPGGAAHSADGSARKCKRE